jgi:hypothetical protein
MTPRASRSPHAVARPSAEHLRRLAFAALLASLPFLPHLDSSAFQFPAVSHAWTLLVFAALMLLPFLGRLERRGGLVELLLLAALATPLALERPPRQWPVMLVYPLLGALAIRMLLRARSGESSARMAIHPRLPRGWMVIGIAVLALVHVGWAAQGRVSSDVAEGGVRGAHRILDGRRLYGPPRVRTAPDPHTDTYGPFDYEAYVPFATVAGPRLASRLTTVLFDLLTALLLFALGRRLRGPSSGVALAYCWLAFPLALYEDALGLNDSIVAASLVAVILASGSPVRRGALAAVAAWTKLSPLALIPLLAGHGGRGRGADGRDALRFAAAFVLASAIVFAPVLAHGSIGEFVARSFGFQAARSPSESLWSSLQIAYARQIPALAPGANVLHGLLVAATGTLVLLLFGARGRDDAVGLAAASAAVLIMVQACLSYYAYSYILWFAPLVLIAAVLGTLPAEPPRSRARAGRPRTRRTRAAGRADVVRPSEHELAGA